jgi:hypothetical protein
MQPVTSFPQTETKFIDLDATTGEILNIHQDHIPGIISVDILAAVKKGVSKIRPSRIRRNGSQYMELAKEKINGLKPVFQSAIKPGSGQLVKFKDFSHIQRVVYETKQDKLRRVKRELLDAGSTLYGLMKSETKILPKLLHPGEHIEAVVYGQHHANSVMLVATSERIIYLDKKPMALFLDEVSYEVVSGLEFQIHTLFATLVLHTPVKNYDIRFVNLRCAENFAKHIEDKRLAKERAEAGKEEQPSGVIKAPLIDQRREPINTMAGYYLLPIQDEEKKRV